MSIDITIHLSDADLEKFQETVDQGSQAVIDSEGAEAVETAAAELIQIAREQELPRSIGKTNAIFT